MVAGAQYLGDIARTSSKSTLQFKALPVDDPKRRKPIIDAARHVLGWQPSIPIEKGIEATIAYFSLSLATQDSQSGTAPTRKRQVRRSAAAATAEAR